MHDQHDRFIDELFDAALRRHGSAEPPRDLEDRILARLRAEPRSSPRLAWPRWALAGAAVALAISTVILYEARLRDHASHSGGPRNLVSAGAHQVNSPSPGPVAAARTGRFRTRPGTRRPHRTPSATAVSRPSQFPTPAPLSEEEKLLVEYVRATPREVLLASLEKEQSIAKDLKIAPLVISPLDGRSEPEAETREDR